MEATIYIGGAKDDASFDDDEFTLMSDALTAAGVTHTLVTYPAAHGFAGPDNPTFDLDAAERHWQALEACTRPHSSEADGELAREVRARRVQLGRPRA